MAVMAASWSSVAWLKAAPATRFSWERYDEAYELWFRYRDGGVWRIGRLGGVEWP